MMGREEDRVDLGELIVYHRGGFMPYREATLGLLTHALQYGTGCFEGIRAFWSDEAEQLYVFEPVAHYRRLRRSGNLLLMDLPHTDDELTEITLELCRRNGFRGDAYIRPLLYKSEEFFGVRLDDVGHDLAIVAFPNSKYLDTDDGLKLCVSSWRRVDDNATPARAKITGSYVNVAFAKSEARLNGFDDAIVLSDDGHVSEASAANLFVLRDGVATTPDLSQNLLEAPGAVLQRVGQQAQRGLAVRHEAATVIDDELSEVHAVFLPSHHRAAEGRAGWPFGARSGRAMVPLLQRPGIVRVLSVLPRVEIPVRQGPRKRDVGEGEVDRLAVAGIVAADDAVQVGHHRIALNDAHRDRERHRIDFFAPGDEELVGRDQLVQLERLLVAEDLAQPVALDVADRKDVQVQLIALDLERVDPVVRLDDRAHAADHRQRGVVRLGRRHLGDRMRPRGRRFEDIGGRRPGIAGFVERRPVEAERTARVVPKDLAGQRSLVEIPNPDVERVAVHEVGVAVGRLLRAGDRVALERRRRTMGAKLRPDQPEHPLRGRGRLARGGRHRGRHGAHRRGQGEDQPDQPGQHEAPDEKRRLEWFRAHDGSTFSSAPEFAPQTGPSPPCRPYDRGSKYQSGSVAGNAIALKAKSTSLPSPLYPPPTEPWMFPITGKPSAVPIVIVRVTGYVVLRSTNSLSATISLRTS